MKLWSVLITLSYALTALADDVPLCKGPVGEILGCEKDLAAISKAAERYERKAPESWWSAEPQSIANAPCRRKAPYSEVELVAWAKAFASGAREKESRVIHGIRFEDESPEMLALFEKLTTFKTDSAAEKKEDQRQFKSSCTRVLCAVQEIFNKKEGPQLLFMLKNYGLNGSYLAHKNTSSWRDYELDDILLGLSDLPSGIFSIDDNKQLTRFKRGQTLAIYGAGNTVANAQINFFDVWSELPAEKRQYTVTHEIAHFVAQGYKLDEDDWEHLNGGWTQETTIVGGSAKEKLVPKDPTKFTSLYGMTNNAEDFAESVTAYRFSPEALKAASPAKYQRIKEVVYDGIEYTSEAACDPSHSIIAAFEKTARAELEGRKQPLSDSELEPLVRACAQELITRRNAQGGSYAKCISNALLRSRIEARLAKAIPPFENLRLMSKAVMRRNFDPLSNTILQPLASRVSNTLTQKYSDTLLGGSTRLQMSARRENEDDVNYCDRVYESSGLQFKLADFALPERRFELADRYKNFIKSICIDQLAQKIAPQLDLDEYSFRCVVAPYVPRADFAEQETLLKACRGDDEITKKYLGELKTKLKESTSMSPGTRVAILRACGSQIISSMSPGGKSAFSSGTVDCIKQNAASALVAGFAESADDKGAVLLRRAALIHAIKAEATAFATVAVKETQSQLRDAFIDFVAAHDSLRPQRSPSSDTESFCTEWSKFGYQSADKNLTPLLNIRAYEHNSFFDSYLKSICVSAYADSTDRKPLTRRQIACGVYPTFPEDGGIEELCLGKRGTYVAVQEKVAPYLNGSKIPAGFAVEHQKRCGSDIFESLSVAQFPFEAKLDRCLEALFMNQAYSAAANESQLSLGSSEVAAISSLARYDLQPAKLVATRRRIQNEVNRGLLDGFLESMLQHDKLRSVDVSRLSSLSVNAYCEKWSANLHGSTHGLTRTYGNGSPLFAINHSPLIDKIGFNACLQYQTPNRRIEPFDRERLSKILDQYFPAAR